MPLVIEAAPTGGADETLEVRADGEVLARCSLWWSSTPLRSGRRAGYVGAYARSDARAAAVVLERACRRLAAMGCREAVGPIDGSTWHRYRFVTERGERPRFFLEPDNPDEYPLDFVASGFAPIERYVSAEELELERTDPRTARTLARLQAAGIAIRRFDPACYERELDAIYDVASASFRTAALFAPISRERFHASYAPLRDRIDPDFVRIAEHDGRAVAFSFGIPDYAALERGVPIDTLVGKTQARLPQRRYAGLAAVMLDDVRRVACERGLRRIVHALVREGNGPSLNGTTRVASVFRRYTLYGRAIA